MTPPNHTDDTILDKGFQVNLRVVYLLIAGTAVAVASVVGVYYSFELKFNDLQHTIRDLERRLQIIENNKPR
jgi:hypothetical protein